MIDFTKPKILDTLKKSKAHPYEMRLNPTKKRFMNRDLLLLFQPLVLRV